MKLAFLVVGTLGTSVHAGLRINVSGSLPMGIYRVVGDERLVERGSIVVVCLPDKWSRFAVERGILGRGHCPGGNYGLGKVVVAMEGDIVTLSQGRLVVGGSVLQNGQTLDRDRWGRALPHHPWGRYTLRKGEVWLYSCHRSAFDSRYFGPVSEERIARVVKPVLTDVDWFLGNREACR